MNGGDPKTFIGKEIPIVKNGSLISGLWDFKGYHPEGCFEKPSCWIEKLGLNFKGRDWRNEGMAFKTYW